MRVATRAIVICLLFCPPGMAQSARETLENASKALGAANLRSIQYAGTGSVFTLGQNVNPTAPWPKVTLKAFTRTVDYEAPGYLEETVRVTPAGEQRQTQVVHANHAWNVGGTNATAVP